MLPPAFSSPLRTLFYLATLCVIAPIAEEIFFRRFVFVSLRKKHSKIYAITCSAIIFGVVHFEGFIIAAIMGSILAYIYEKEEKLMIPIIIHAMKNLAAVLAELAHYYIN
jgi:membrane protease YdiL (CAAX protease family)